MANGTSRAIEQVLVGDEVLADDPEDELPVGPRAVSAVHRNWTEAFMNVGLDHNGDGTADAVMRVTREHPVWTQNRGWVKAGLLGRADRLVGPDASCTTTVTGVEARPEVSATFNLSVSEDSTYFVLAGNVPVLVHNTNPGPRLWVVYQVKQRGTGKTYTGRTSIADPHGTATVDEALRARYNHPSKNKLDLDLSTIKEVTPPLRGDKHSEAYKATRGAEQLHYEKALSEGHGLKQDKNPVSADNKNYKEYINAARRSGVTPCQGL